MRTTEEACALYRRAKAKRAALAHTGEFEHWVGDEAALIAAFDRTLATLKMAYQPIVRWSTRSVHAYEALMRPSDPVLRHPGAVLEAAERLHRVHELGRVVRSRAVAPLGELPEGISLYINLHADELTDEQLYDAEQPWAASSGRLVLEVTERASLAGFSRLPEQLRGLRARGMKIALDDLGAGYAGLASFSLLEPDVVKLDMSLVRDVHRETTKQTIVRTMVSMCAQLHITVVAEGVETVEERDELARLGCDLMQGYLFAKPGAAFPTPVF